MTPEEELASIFERVVVAPLAPDDLLVVRCKTALSLEHAIKLDQYIESKMPAGTKVLVIDSTVDLSIVRGERPPAVDEPAIDPLKRHRPLSG